MQQDEIGVVSPQPSSWPIHDRCLVDTRMASLFSVIGNIRSLFQGIANWRWLDDAHSSASRQMLERHGEKKWLERGGTRDATGTLTCFVPSALSDHVMERLIERYNGYLQLGLDGSATAFHFESAEGGHTSRYWAFSITASVQSDESQTSTRDALRNGLREAARQLRLYRRAEQFLWLIHSEVLRQQSSSVVIADAQCGQLIWGGDRQSWPRSWRGDVVDTLRSLASIRIASIRIGGEKARAIRDFTLIAPIDRRFQDEDKGAVCPAQCPLHEMLENHGHICIEIGTAFLGSLEQYAATSNGRRHYEIPNRDTGSGKDQSEKSQRPALKDQPIRNVSLVSKLFGPAPWAELPQEQRNIIQGLLREVTRRRQSSRADRADIIRGNEVPSFNGKSQVRCPSLSADGRYVAFGGNGKRRGLGYAIVGATGRGWMFKCGCGADGIEDTKRGAISQFFKHLRQVASLFGLTYVGINTASQQWYGPDELEVAVGSRDRGLIHRIHLRVYGPEDYLDRIRGYFAKRGVFERVTRPGDVLPAQQQVHDGLEVIVRMKRLRVTQKALATHLGISHSHVSNLLGGKRRWTGELKGQVEAYLASREAAGTKPEETSVRTMGAGVSQ